MDNIVENGKIIKLRDNYVLITQDELERLQRDSANLAYKEKLERAFENIKNGKVKKHDLIEVD